MSDIQKGTTFADTAPGNTVTAAQLNHLVDGATILPAFVGEKPFLAPNPADCLLIYQASTAEFGKVTLAQLLALLPPPPGPVLVGGTAPGPEFQNGGFVWIKTVGEIDGEVNGLKIWSAASTSWEPVHSLPRLSIVRYAGDTGAPYFDPGGLGLQGRWRGWALCNGGNGTPNLNAGTEKYIQLRA